MVNRVFAGVWSVMPLRSLCLVLLSLIASVLRADDTEVLDIKLVSEVTSIAPGQPFYLGLALHHGEGYHSYWKHPGTVGVPTNIKWLSLPPGFTAEPIDWPEPEPVLMFQIKAQGYERDVVLPIRITPPAELQEGETLTFTGKASWMCCNRECHPGFKDLSITLPVRKMAAPDLDSKWHEKFEAERAIRPRASTAWSSTLEAAGKTLTLTLKPGLGAARIPVGDAAKIIYFTEDGMVDSDKPQRVEVLLDGSVQLTLVEAEFIIGDRPAALAGVLLYRPGWEEGGKLSCLRVTVPLARPR